MEGPEKRVFNVNVNIFLFGLLDFKFIFNDLYIWIKVTVQSIFIYKHSLCEVWAKEFKRKENVALHNVMLGMTLTLDWKTCLQVTGQRLVQTSDVRQTDHYRVAAELNNLSCNNVALSVLYMKLKNPSHSPKQIGRGLP